MKLRKTYAVALCVAGTCVSGWASAGEQPDIAGIHFGVPHKDAAALVRSVDQALVVSEIKSRQGKSAGWKGISPTDKVLVLTDDANGDVWFVGRSQGLGPGAHIDPEKLRQSLIAKYGTPSTGAEKGAPAMTWDFDRDGHLVKTIRPGAGPGPCALLLADSPALSDVPILIPGRFSSTCGMRITATYLEDARDHLVNGWEIRMSHDAVRYDELNRQAKTSDSAQAAERARQAAANRPKL